jgi:alkanesulfonate monooxygenase
LKHKLEVLEGHCEAVGRPFSDIEKTALASAYVGVDNAELNMTPDDVITMCRELADIGIEHVIFNMPFNVQEITPLEVFGKEILPVVTEF